MIKCVLKCLFVVPLLILSVASTFLIQLPLLILMAIPMLAGCLDVEKLPDDPWFILLMEWYEDL